MSEAGPKLFQLFGSSDPYSVPSRTTKSASAASPASMRRAWPFAATAGVLVRSPLSVWMGNPSTLPWTVSSRCALLRSRVVWADCVSSVAASGNGEPDCWLDEDFEQPATTAADNATAARMAAVLRRKGMACIVEGHGDGPGSRT